MVNKRLFAFFMAWIMLAVGVRWPAVTVRAEERTDLGRTTVERTAVATVSEAEERATASEAGWDDEKRDDEGGDLCIGCDEPDQGELESRFVMNQAASGAGKLEVDGVSVWYLNYMPDSREKDYSYEVLDVDGQEVDQTWWNYWWEGELDGWRIQAKPTQYSYDQKEYRYFILDGDGVLTAAIPAEIDGKPVVSMDRCFSAWPLPLTDPGRLPETVVSAEHCYEGTAIRAMPDLPDCLKNMNYMFYECGGLVETAPIPEGVEEMDYAFGSSGILETPVFLGKGNIRALKFTFSNCTSLERINGLPEGLERLEQTFWCGLAKGADLRGDVIPDSVTVMEETFYRSNIRYAPKLPPGLERMDGCFQDCGGLREVPLLPDSVVSADQAFADCRGLQFGNEGHVCVAAPRSLINADQMFRAAYRTDGRPDEYGRDSEILYLWNERQWKNIYQQSYGEMPVDRDVWGDYILPSTPIGLTFMELLDTAPYIETALVVADGKRAVQVRFDGVFGTFGEEPDYYPGDRIQYRINGVGDFVDWDGRPLSLYDDAVVEARKIREVETYSGAEQVTGKVRTKEVSVRQPEMPVFSYEYLGGGKFDVTVMYRPYLRSLQEVEMMYRVNDQGGWKPVQNLGRISASCEDVITAYADWGALSEISSLRLPDYVKRITFANPRQYEGLQTDLPVVCDVFENDAADRSYTVSIVQDDEGIVELVSDENGNWRFSTTGYGKVTLEAAANDGSGVSAEHTIEFVSRVTDLTVALKDNPERKMNIGDRCEVVVETVPGNMNSHSLRLSNGILTYDEDDHMVTAVTGGTEVLTAVSTVDPSLTDQIEVTVLPRPDRITAEPVSQELYSDEAARIRSSWNPYQASVPEVWTGGMEVQNSVQYQSENMLISGFKAVDSKESGQTTVTFSAGSGSDVKCVCTITWKPFIHRIKLTGPPQIPAGSRARAVLVKDVESDERLYYESSDKEILEIDQNGEMTARRQGTVTVTVTASHGNASDSMEIQVVRPENQDIVSLDLTVDRNSLTVGEETRYQVATDPVYTAGTYTVTSSDPGVVEVEGETSGEGTAGAGSGVLKARGAGTVTICVQEDINQEEAEQGKVAAFDEETVTVTPNHSAVLTVGPSGELWEKNGRVVVYKNLPGGQAVDFEYQILTDAVDQTVVWSVDKGELAQIDQSGRLRPKQNGVVTVRAVSNAYPDVRAEYQLEIRTVATDITFTITRSTDSGFRLWAQKVPVDASPERLYCKRQYDGAYRDITETGFDMPYYGDFVYLSTCLGDPSLEDMRKTVVADAFFPSEQRYELRSLHDDRPYTVDTSDMNDQNEFQMRIYDTREKRYLGAGETTGIHLEQVQMYMEPPRDPAPWDISSLNVSGEADGRVTIGAGVYSGDALNQLDQVCMKIPFWTQRRGGEGFYGLTVREYCISAKPGIPAAVQLRCLDKKGMERYDYDLSVYTGGIPEFHINSDSRIPKAGNSEYGEFYLDINGERFNSLSACLERYEVSIYQDGVNITDQVLEPVDSSGRPRVTLIGDGRYDVNVCSAGSGIADGKEVAAHGGAGFISMCLLYPTPNTGIDYARSIFSIETFQGEIEVYPAGRPFAGTTIPNEWIVGRNGEDYLIGPPYELDIELLPDRDGAVLGDAAGNRITAKGYTKSTERGLDENIKAVLKRSGTPAAYIYGRYEVRNQLPGIRLGSQAFECGQEGEVSLGYQMDTNSVMIPKTDIDSSFVKIQLDRQQIDGCGDYDGFEVTQIEDGVISLRFDSVPRFSPELKVYFNGDKLFERSGDESLKGQEISTADTSLTVTGAPYAAVEDVRMKLGETAVLQVRCGVGTGISTGTITNYSVLNAAAGEIPLVLEGGTVSASRAGEWLVQANVRFYGNGTYRNVSCQFKVTVKNPAAELTITERNGRTECGVGETLYLVPGYAPVGADNISGYEWSIADHQDGAALDQDRTALGQDGTVRALESGVYTVELRDLPDRSLKAAYDFTVKDLPVQSESISISPENTECTNHERVTFHAVISPADAADQELIWSVEADRDKAVVNREGVFSGRRAGTYLVRAALAGKPEISAQAQVTVSVLPESIYITGDHYVDLNSQVLLTANILPPDAADQDIYWEIVAGNELAGIDQDGMVVSGNKIGRIKVRAVVKDQTAEGQATAEGRETDAEHEIAVGKVLPMIAVDIKDKDGNLKTEIKDREDAAYLYINGSRATETFLKKNQYHVSVQPEPLGIVLDHMGVIHGVSQGKYTVTASRAVDGVAVSDTALLSVLNAAKYEYLTVRPKDGDYRLSGRKGKKELEYVLSPALKPEDAAEWRIISGSELADLADNGVLSANGMDNGKVTVECCIRGKESREVYLTQYCTIILQNQYIGVTGIQVKCPSPVNVGDKVGISVAVFPENVNNRGAHLSVSDSSVGCIEDGYLIAVKPGEIKITAVSEENGAYSDFVMVTVVQDEGGGDEPEPGPKPDPKPGPGPDYPAGSGSEGNRAVGDQWEYWVLRNSSWYYYHVNGMMAESEWVMYRNQWYWLQKGGIMRSNSWLYQGDSAYYLGNNGAMAADSWARVDGRWYYFDNYGQVNDDQAGLTGFTAVEDQLVYIGSVEGHWVQIGSHIYYIDDRKYVRTNRWIRDGEDWYYVGDNGWMLCGQWNEVTGQWYFMNPNGHMEKYSTVWEGHIYRMDSKGAAQNSYFSHPA